MIRIALPIFLALFLISCGGEDGDIDTTSNEGNDTTSVNTTDRLENDSVVEDTIDADPLMNTTVAEVTFECYQNDDKSWGYKVFMDGNMYVNQPHIPAVQGKNGFSSESDATKTAELVADKVRNGISPPTVSKEELQELGVIK